MPQINSKFHFVGICFKRLAWNPNFCETGATPWGYGHIRQDFSRLTWLYVAVRQLSSDYNGHPASVYVLLSVAKMDALCEFLFSIIMCCAVKLRRILKEITGIIIFTARDRQKESLINFFPNLKKHWNKLWQNGIPQSTARQNTWETPPTTTTCRINKN